MARGREGRDALAVALEIDRMIAARPRQVT